MPKKATKKDLDEMLSKIGTELILLVMRENKTLKLEELQAIIKGNVSRSTLFKRLGEMVDKSILIRNRGGSKQGGTKYSISDENIRLFEELITPSPIYDFEKKMIILQISSSKSLFEIASGIYLSDPHGNWNGEKISPYSKVLGERPSELFTIVKQIHIQNALMELERYFSKVEVVLDNIQDRVKEGYALGYAIEHIEWWRRSNSVDGSQVDEAITKFKNNFDEGTINLATEYSENIKILNEKQKELDTFSGTQYGGIDLWFADDVEELKQLGILTEEDVFWLAVLKENGRLLHVCVKNLPREFPKIIIDTKFI